MPGERDRRCSGNTCKFRHAWAADGPEPRQIGNPLEQAANVTSRRKCRGPLRYGTVGENSVAGDADRNGHGGPVLFETRMMDFKRHTEPAADRAGADTVSWRAVEIGAAGTQSVGVDNPRPAFRTRFTPHLLSPYAALAVMGSW